MAFNDLETYRIKKEVGGFCEKRTPAHLKDKLRYEYEVEGQDVIIYEIRPAFMKEGEFTKMPMAKLTYVSSAKSGNFSGSGQAENGKNTSQRTRIQI